MYVTCSHVGPACTVTHSARMSTQHEHARERVRAAAREGGEERRETRSGASAQCALAEMSEPAHSRVRQAGEM